MTTTEGTSAGRPDASFPKACRLRKPGDFKAVYRQGRRTSSRSFVAFILPNAIVLSRFGLTTPRKLGKAHDRNRIRRRVREILRRDRWRLPPGRDVVLNPRRSVLTRDMEALRGELMSLLQSGS